MGQTIVIADAFTDRPFEGNPAAVCVIDGPRGERWMQLVAREMNYSETAFLHREPASDASEGPVYRLRWFTPVAEVDLCGHATLASAHVLWEEGHLAPGERARFHTRSGLLTAAREGDWIWLDFPAEPPAPTPAPADLARALGAAPVWVGKNRFDYLVEVATEADVRALRPDFGLLAAIPARGFIVTSRAAGTEYDFVSRFFGPAVGVNEDPATGSAHCCLAPFWAARLGRDELTGYQASARGGVVRVRNRGDRVEIGGQAVTVLRGELVE